MQNQSDWQFGWKNARYGVKGKVNNKTADCFGSAMTSFVRF